MSSFIDATTLTELIKKKTKDIYELKKQYKIVTGKEFPEIVRDPEEYSQYHDYIKNTVLDRIGRNPDKSRRRHPIFSRYNGPFDSFDKIIEDITTESYEKIADMVYYFKEEFGEDDYDYDKDTFHDFMSSLLDCAFKSLNIDDDSLDHARYELENIFFKPYM